MRSEQYDPRQLVHLGVLPGAGFGVMTRFQASKSESLRTFVNYHYVTQAPFKILVATTIGAVTGAIGGLFGTWMPGNQAQSRAARTP